MGGQEIFGWVVVYLGIASFGFAIGWSISQSLKREDMDRMRRRCFNGKCECRCHEEYSYV